MFSLWSDPWIDVINADGGCERVSIETCFKQAQQLRGIAAPSPLSSIGIQRLLIAIAQDMVRPATVDDVAGLLEAGEFAPRLLDTFAMAYAPRFALFDDDAPFLQRPGPCDEIRKPGRKAVAALFVEVPSGTRRAWWKRHFEDAYVVCPACAAAGMLAFPAAATNFGKGNRATIVGAGVRYVLPSGPNLFVALARSVLAPEYQAPTAHGDPTSAPWTWPADAIGASEHTTVGYLESLVFPSRTIRLIPEARSITCARCGLPSNLAVAEVLFAGGWHYRGAWLDPFVAYRQTRQGRLFPVAADDAIVSWRALAPLMSRAPPGSQRPLVIDQLAALQQRGAVPDTALLTFRCAGLVVIDQARYRTWIDEVLTIPPAALRDDALAARLGGAVARAEEAARALALTLRADELVGAETLEATVRRLWGDLVTAFQRLIVTVSPASPAEVFDAWDRAVLIAARAHGEAALRAATAASPLRLAQARQALGRTLGGIAKRWQSTKEAV